MSLLQAFRDILDLNHPHSGEQRGGRRQHVAQAKGGKMGSQGDSRQGVMSREYVSSQKNNRGAGITVK